MKLRYKLVATGMGMGLSPIAPGSVGALGGCLLAVLLKQWVPYPDTWLSILIILFFFTGVYCATKVEAEWGEDPSKVVIDEVVGMWVAMWIIPQGWIGVVAAFILFRFFDIYKPLFIRNMEKLKGGWGIMMDDLLAGIYANVIIQVSYIIMVSINGK
jgi:phosphatidylglycerophosphatase A